MSLFHQRNLLTSVALGAVLACGQPALAQAPKIPPANLVQPAVPPTSPAELSGNRGIDNRLDRDEKTLRDLRAIVLQATATHQPVEVKDAGPDPVVADLQTKLDDLTQTLSRLNGQVETLGHNIDLASKALADSAEANKALATRLDKLEAAVQVLQTSPPPAAAATSADLGPGPVQADEGLAYTQARKVLDTGDNAGGAAALEDYLARFPGSPRAPEANYWLGRALAAQKMHREAADSLAHSLQGWPQTDWAGKAVVWLAASLIELKQTDQACKALTDFDVR
jgi:TolA-binding protein